VGSRRLALKVDVDTERGTRIHAPALARTLAEAGVPATFFFSLGPDRTGRAIRRVLRPGFTSKVRRTNVLATYGLRTLLNGLLLPGPQIAGRHAGILRSIRDAGFGVAVHCWDHVRWQDELRSLSDPEVRVELGKAFSCFEDVFRVRASAAGAAGWQADARSLAAYDEYGLAWASDARGTGPFLPRVGNRVFRTPQIPTTLPTLDELLGRPEHPRETLVDQLVGWLRPGALEVMTLHAEIEGGRERPILQRLLAALAAAGVEIVRLEDEAAQLGREPERLAVCELIEASVPGRSGTLVLQGPCDPATARRA
jgi:peptidoglycan/xylan/chitin deacetylase (PgdA/CDA1 family)